MKYKLQTLLCLMLAFSINPAYATPDDETFPWEVVTTDYTRIWKNPSMDSKVLCEVPEGTSFIAIKRSVFSEWVKVLVTVDYAEIKGYAPVRRLNFVRSLAEEQQELKADDKAKTRNSLINWGIGIFATLLITICCTIFGRGKIKDIGTAVLSLIISLLVTVVFGVFPPLLVVDAVEGMRWWMVVLGLAVMAFWVTIAIIKVRNVSSTLSYVFFHQVIKVALPAIITILFVLFANWMESWKVSGFWGGAGIWFLTMLGILIAAAFIRMAVTLIKNFFGEYKVIDIINAAAFAYMGVIMGLTIFSAGENACSPAAWLALIGLIPGGLVAAEDPFPLEINGEKSKEISPGHYVTSKGTRLHEEKSGWGKDIKMD